MHKDTVVGILGAVILVAAMVGIFYYEGTQVPSGASNGTGGTGGPRLNWTTATAQLPDITGATNEGASSEETVTLNQTNITEVEFMLQWTDDVPNSGPDNFHVTVTGPGVNYTGEGTGTAGFSVIVQIMAQPNQTSGTAAQLAQWASTMGMGAWNVTIELTDAGDVGPPSPVPPPVPIPNVTDTGNGWTLMVHVTTYQARAA